MSAHETVPADIEAAIEQLIHTTEGSMVNVGDVGQHKARADFDAVILKHLRGHAEMKAALERIEQGV